MSTNQICPRSPVVVIIMGVTGSGKTTIGRLLALELGWQFWDADDFHPDANIQKMRRGIALTDDDRSSWLRCLRGIIDDSTQHGRSGILACSSLKERYRKILSDGGLPVQFVYLRGSADIFEARLRTRQGHFMNPNLLSSQLATLEEPQEAIVIDAFRTPEEIVAAIRSALDPGPRRSSSRGKRCCAARQDPQ